MKLPTQDSSPSDRPHSTGLHASRLYEHDNLTYRLHGAPLLIVESNPEDEQPKRDSTLQRPRPIVYQASEPVTSHTAHPFFSPYIAPHDQPTTNLTLPPTHDDRSVASALLLPDSKEKSSAPLQRMTFSHSSGKPFSARRRVLQPPKDLSKLTPKISTTNGPRNEALSASAETKVTLHGIYSNIAKNSNPHFELQNNSDAPLVEQDEVTTPVSSRVTLLDNFQISERRESHTDAPTIRKEVSTISGRHEEFYESPYIYQPNFYHLGTKTNDALTSKGSSAQLSVNTPVFHQESVASPIEASTGDIISLPPWSTESVVTIPQSWDVDGLMTTPSAFDTAVLDEPLNSDETERVSSFNDDQIVYEQTSSTDSVFLSNHNLSSPNFFTKPAITNSVPTHSSTEQYKHKHSISSSSFPSIVSKTTASSDLFPSFVTIGLEPTSVNALSTPSVTEVKNSFNNVTKINYKRNLDESTSVTSDLLEYSLNVKDNERTMTWLPDILAHTSVTDVEASSTQRIASTPSLIPHHAGNAVHNESNSVAGEPYSISLWKNTSDITINPVNNVSSLYLVEQSSVTNVADPIQSLVTDIIDSSETDPVDDLIVSTETDPVNSVNDPIKTTVTKPIYNTVTDPTDIIGTDSTSTPATNPRSVSHFEFYPVTDLIDEPVINTIVPKMVTAYSIAEDLTLYSPEAKSIDQEQTTRQGVSLDLPDPIIKQTTEQGVPLDLADPIIEQITLQGVSTDLPDPIIEQTTRQGVPLDLADSIIEQTTQQGVPLDLADPIIELQYNSTFSDSSTNELDISRTSVEPAEIGIPQDSTTSSDYLETEAINSDLAEDDHTSRYFYSTIESEQFGDMSRPNETYTFPTVTSRSIPSKNSSNLSLGHNLNHLDDLDFLNSSSEALDGRGSSVTGGNDQILGTGAILLISSSIILVLLVVLLSLFIYRRNSVSRKVYVTPSKRMPMSRMDNWEKDPTFIPFDWSLSNEVNGVERIGPTKSYITKPMPPAILPHELQKLSSRVPLPQEFHEFNNCYAYDGPQKDSPLKGGSQSDDNHYSSRQNDRAKLRQQLRLVFDNRKASYEESRTEQHSPSSLSSYSDGRPSRFARHLVPPTPPLSRKGSVTTTWSSGLGGSSCNLDYATDDHEQHDSGCSASTNQLHVQVEVHVDSDASNGGGSGFAAGSVDGEVVVSGNGLPLENVVFNRLDGGGGYCSASRMRGSNNTLVPSDGLDNKGADFGPERRNSLQNIHLNTDEEDSNYCTSGRKFSGPRSLQMKNAGPRALMVFSSNGEETTLESPSALLPKIPPPPYNRTSTSDA